MNQIVRLYRPCRSGRTRGCAVVLWALVCLPALGAQPAPYGEEFARFGSDWEDGTPPPAVLGERDDPGAAQRQSWLARLEAEEIGGGPYADGLAEPLTDIARSLHAAGDLESARGFYRRALHIVRINDGLYSRRQVPLLRALLQTYRQVGDFEALDERYDYLFRLFGAGQPPHTEVRLRATLEYLRWQREALRRNLDEKGDRRLLRLYELNRDLLESLDSQRPEDYQAYRAATLSQLRNLYLVMDRVEPRTSEQGLVYYDPFPETGPDSLNEMDITRTRLEAIHRRGLSAGEDLLESLRAHAATEGELAEALVALERADWYQWNNAYNRAREQYAEAEQLLLRAGEERLLSELLGEPRELPDNGAFWQQPDAWREGRVVRVAAKFDVSERGRVRNVTTPGVSESKSYAARSLRRRLSETRFRPRFHDGEPLASEGVMVEYEFYDDD
jgi:hypothetical protein